MGAVPGERRPVRGDGGPCLEAHPEPVEAPAARGCALRRRRSVPAIPTRTGDSDGPALGPRPAALCSARGDAGPVLPASHARSLASGGKRETVPPAGRGHWGPPRRAASLSLSRSFGRQLVANTVFSPRCVKKTRPSPRAARPAGGATHAPFTAAPSRRPALLFTPASPTLR